VPIANRDSRRIPEQRVGDQSARAAAKRLRNPKNGLAHGEVAETLIQLEEAHRGPAIVDMVRAGLFFKDPVDCRAKFVDLFAGQDTWKMGVA